MSAPTPAEFLAQPVDPDEDADQIVLHPLERIAQALQVIAGLDSGHAREAEAAAGVDREATHRALQLAYTELEERCEKQRALLQGVLDILKPSVSKLANQVRDFVAVETAEPAPEPESVEEPAPAAEEPSPTVEDFARATAIANGVDPEQVVAALPKEGEVHNHSFEKADDGKTYACACGFTIPA